MSDIIVGTDLRKTKLTVSINGEGNFDAIAFRLPKVKKLTRRSIKLPSNIDPEKIKGVWISSEKLKKVEGIFDLRHFYTAFMEDRGHDWNLSKNILHYAGSAGTGKIWLIIIMETENTK